MCTYHYYYVLIASVFLGLEECRGDYCFQRQCGSHQGALDTSCLQDSTNQWMCRNDQFCKMDVNHEGDIHMHCAHPHELSHCLQEMAEQDPDCSPLAYPPVAPCHFCCLDADCVRNSFVPLLAAATTAIPIGGATTVGGGGNQAAGYSLVPGSKSCFTSDCDHGVTADQCMSGQYACPSDQFCKLDFNHDGSIKMHCQEWSHLKDCLSEQQKGETACCLDAVCLRNSFSVANNPTTATTTTKPTPTPTPTETTTTTTTTTIPTTLTTATTTTIPTITTTSPPPTTKATTKATTATTTTTPSTAKAWECQDHYTEDCSVDFAGRCSDPVVSQVCQKTCGLCVQPTTPPIDCVDKLPSGTCSEPQIVGACATQTIRDVCPVTCKVCPGCVDLLPGSTCSEPQMANSCSQQAIRDVCPATCNACPGQGQGSSETHAPPPPTTTTTTLSCKQCGHYGSGTSCTDEELLFDELKPCDDVTASFCMTDVIIDANSKVSIYKRCVSHAVCENQWYRQTSDMAACLNFDPSSVTPDLACHFCCVGVGCNANIVPPRDVQWRP